MAIISDSPPALATTRQTATHLRTTEAWRLGGVSVIWLLFLVAVSIWVEGAGLQALLGTTGDALTSFARLCGLVASTLLLIQVLLMARVPLFERGFGHDALTRTHRLTGFWSFWLMLAHIALVVLGYSANAQRGVLAQLWTMVTTFADMVPAVIGTLLLLGIVALSIRRSRRRLRYETWHLAHLWAYVGTAMVLPHQLSTGSDFAAAPLTSLYWWSLWGVALGCVLVFRVLQPLRRSLRHRLTVESVTPDGTRGAVVTLTGRDLDALGIEPGQFFFWRFLDGSGWPAAHPFSVSTRPDSTHLDITVRVVGDGTRRISTLRPGTRVLIEGPYGAMTGRVRRGRRLLMIGAGAGVSPLVSLLMSLDYHPGEATLITRESRREEALLTRPIESLVATRGVTHMPIVGPRAIAGSTWMTGARGAAGDGEALLRTHLTDPGDTDVYLCGPPRWMASVRADLKRLGVPRDNVHLENFGI